MRTHQLKIWPLFFVSILSGRKKYEIRRNDRGFELGDQLDLLEWDPELRDYTGRCCRVVVVHLTYGNWTAGGIRVSLLPEDVCVMGIELLP